MIDSLLAIILILATTARCAPQIFEKCREVPKNPVAERIGAEFLTIPGCDGTAGKKPDIPIIVPPEIDPLPVENNLPPPPPPANPSPLPVLNGGGGGGGGVSQTNTTGSALSAGDESGNIGQMYSSAITRYGQGPKPETVGTDGNCQTNAGACGNNPRSGYTAALSEFLYFHGGTNVGSRGNTGGGNGGLACGTCWKLWGGNDGGGNAISSTPIVVLVTNMCAHELPGQEKNMCGMGSLEEKNAFQMNILVDLCMDSGASQAFWGPPPWGATTGRAQQVDCSQWCGIFADGRISGPPGCITNAADWAVVS